MSKITEVGQLGINLIKSFEGFQSKPYLCPSNIATIGFGTTFYFDTKKRVKLIDKPINIYEGERLLKGHVQTVFAPLVDKLCRDDLNQNQFDAVCSFVYNTGGGYTDKFGKFHYYNLFEKINVNAPDLKDYWENCAITGGGKVLEGLRRRRKAEVELFFR